MKRKGMLVICVISLALYLTGCSGLTGGKTKTEDVAQTETIESVETEPETVTEKTDANKAESGAGLESPGTAAKTRTSEAAQPVPAEETEALQTPQPQTEAQSQWSGAPQSPQVYEEEMMQCPYCAHWFSTLPDDDLWNPYDRHMLEERETDPAGGQTEADMVQCPDCGNWYEAGSVFRNHICTGRQ